MRDSSRKKPGSIAVRHSAQSSFQRRAADHGTGASIVHEPPGLLSPGGITALQRSIGNQGVQRLLRTSAAATLPAPAGPLAIQRKEVRVPHGSATSSTWKFLRTEGSEDVYDDGVPETDIEKLASSRQVIEDFDDELSDAELSDTEIDLRAKSGPKPVYRVKDIREAQKVVKNVMRKDPRRSIAVRTDGSDAVFRLEGRGTQFFVKTVASGALKQHDGTTARGAMPRLAKGDPKATGKRASYQHVASELRNYDSAEVAQAIYDKYFTNVAYPAKFSIRARAKMDELFVILALAESFRADYALALLVAAIKALQNGESMENVLYKGKGQLEALHVGASSHKDSKVSGQLMEQNMGKGRNDPHPTQKSMSISDAHFKTGAKRTHDLFTKAASGQPFDTFLTDTLIKPTRALKKTKMGPGPTGTVTPLSAMGPIPGLPPLPSLTPSGLGSMPTSTSLSMGTPPPTSMPMPQLTSPFPSLSSGMGTGTPPPTSMPMPQLTSPFPSFPSMGTGTPPPTSMPMPQLTSPFPSFPSMGTGMSSLPFLPPVSSLLLSSSPFGIVPFSLPPLVPSGLSSLSSPPMASLSSLPPSGSLASAQPTSLPLGPSSAFASASIFSPPPPITASLSSMPSAFASVSAPPPTPTFATTAIDSIVQSEQKPAGKWKIDKVVKLMSGAPALTVGQQVQYQGVTYTVKNITPMGRVMLKR
ncbi:MAG: hypothetical protein JOZ51_00820 [Chloroflexi bacterium]|nr:hypothetical protein [Chloroflexota bacterium]